MNFSLYIAKRYLFTKSNNNAINYISIFASICVVFASAALFIVLSGFAGLKDFSLQFTNEVDPDLKILPKEGKTFVVSKEEMTKLNNIEGIVSYSKVLEERVVLNFETKNELVTIKGVDSNYPKHTIDSILVHGNWMETNSYQIVSGWGISGALSFGVFDFGKTLKIYVPKPGKGQLTSLESAYNSINVVNSGVFQINEEIDNSLIYANLNVVRSLLNTEINEVSGIEIITNGDVDVISSEIQSAFGDAIIIKTRAQLNDALYKMLNTEYLVVYLIFTLILIIALFNVIGSIVMMILDKKKDLNTLFNLGVDIKDIRRIFFFQGSLMSILGGFLGLIIGLLLILNQIYGPQLLKVMITPSLPYPASIKIMNLIIVLVTISVLGIIASKIASARITKSIVKAN